MQEKIVSYNPESMPPREAWKNPSKWLGSIHPDQRIILPTDDRGFVQVDNAFDRVMDLFHDSYKWEFNPDDFRTSPDDHHYYYYEKEWREWSEELALSNNPFELENAKSVIEFRNNATNIGYMLRGIHNALHHTTKKPAMPELEPIVEFIDNFKIASQGLSKIITAVTGILESSSHIDMRRRTIECNPHILAGKNPSDVTNQQMLEDKLNKRYDYLHKTLMQFMGVHDSGIIMPDGQKVHIDEYTPIETIVALGKKARGFSSRDHRPR